MTHQAEIIDALEGAMTVLNIAADMAREDGRRKHANAITAVVRDLEDLRTRNEEFDPDDLNPIFPNVVRDPRGPARAIRIAIANDLSCAIYKLSPTLARRSPFHTAYYFAYPFKPGSTTERTPPVPCDLSMLVNPGSFMWDHIEELDRGSTQFGANEERE